MKLQKEQLFAKKQLKKQFLNYLRLEVWKNPLKKFKKD